MMVKKNHTFHMVDQSPWPIVASLYLMMLTLSSVLWMNYSKMLFIQIMGMTSMISILWWRDINRESSLQGIHTLMIIKNMKWGMILFILSEVMLFLSFFWTYFHSSLSPTNEIGLIWPPQGIKAFNPMKTPLLNTIILLSSGITITWSHHNMMMNLPLTKESMMMTILLGVYFTLLQMMEYAEASFSISDSIYGAIFFLGTGFHGAHVIIGTTFLLVTLSRMKKNMSSAHHFGFEAAAWYWHFVDVVWLFLYLNFYW